jgi:hypothetical protein
MRASILVLDWKLESAIFCKIPFRRLQKRSEEEWQREEKEKESRKRGEEKEWWRG